MEFKHSCRKWSNFSYLSSHILSLTVIKIKWQYAVVKKKKRKRIPPQASQFVVVYVNMMDYLSEFLLQVQTPIWRYMQTSTGIWLLNNYFSKNLKTTAGTQELDFWIGNNNKEGKFF